VNLRSTSPEVHWYTRTPARRRQAGGDEHGDFEAIRSRNPAKARTAMRTHLAAVLEHLLFAIEEKAVEDARQALRPARDRYARAKKL
jgi:GntR family transcriptional repressor for pyruvate dehydrogenase complex